jgi:glucosyl-3-phosphoglycerate synthase
MEYVQERIATLHDFGDARPQAPTDRAAVVVPMTERDHASLAAERVFETLERVAPGHVVVALRATDDQIDAIHEWLTSFDLEMTVLWCTAPSLETRLADVGLAGQIGKGRDVWLALGVAAAERAFVVVHDADAKSYSEQVVSRLLFPLARDYAFTKGYYARVENDRLYGRLFRLFVTPLVRTLADAHDAPLLQYLAAFRYALAGEFAMTAELARTIRAPRGWGLEIGTLGNAFDGAGFERTAQVDLGVHEHDHRAVDGPAGLGDMSREVGETLFHVLADAGVEPDFETLPDRYRAVADDLVGQYATDAAFNGLTYDATAERKQVRSYADAIVPPGPDERLPAWRDAPITPAAVRDIATDALESARE